MIYLEQGNPMNHCNDGKCAADGGLWFGTMNNEAN